MDSVKLKVGCLYKNPNIERGSYFMQYPSATIWLSTKICHQGEREKTPKQKSRENYRKQLHLYNAFPSEFYIDLSTTLSPGGTIAHGAAYATLLGSRPELAHIISMPTSPSSSTWKLFKKSMSIMFVDMGE